MSVAAWRLTRDEKKRSAARVAALSLAAQRRSRPTAPHRASQREVDEAESPERRGRRASAPQDRAVASRSRADVRVAELPLNQPRVEAVRASASRPCRTPRISRRRRKSQRDNGGRQKSLAFAAVILFVVLSGGLVWMMSGPRGTSAVAVGPNSPLELVSLSHAAAEREARGVGPGAQSGGRQADRASVGGRVPVRSHGHVHDQLARATSIS